MDPTRSDDTPVQEVGALKKRLVASERERKQALAEAAAENRALQLQLQVLCRLQELRLWQIEVFWVGGMGVS